MFDIQLNYFFPVDNFKSKEESEVVGFFVSSFHLFLPPARGSNPKAPYTIPILTLWDYSNLYLTFHFFLNKRVRGVKCKI